MKWIEWQFREAIWRAIHQFCFREAIWWLLFVLFCIRMQECSFSCVPTYIIINDHTYTHIESWWQHNLCRFFHSTCSLKKKSQATGCFPSIEHCNEMNVAIPFNSNDSSSATPEVVKLWTRTFLLILFRLHEFLLEKGAK